jgi:hypothetical protein
MLYTVFFIFATIILSQDISLSSVTVLWQDDQGLNPDRDRNFSLHHNFKISFGACLASYPVGAKGSFPRS